MFSQFFNRSGARPQSTIDHDSMVAAVDKGSHLLVDVREIQEFRAGTIKGALNAPLSVFDPAKIPADKPIIVFCAAGGRSGIAQKMLAAAGKSDAVNYRPGVGGWRLQGMPLVRP
ncbi:MAG: rhodanese-like domain-containing protein [Rhizobiaceae bacterium]